MSATIAVEAQEKEFKDVLKNPITMILLLFVIFITIFLCCFIMQNHIL